MYRTCPTEKAAQQQQCFEQSLLEFMQTRPYHTITVKELCTHTGFSRMTFYRLFESKDDVLYALIDRTLQGYVGFYLTEEQIVPTVSAYFQRMYTYWYQQKKLLRALCENQMSAVLMERAIRHITSEDAETMYQIGAENAWNEKEVLQFFISGIMGLAIQWYQTDFEKSIVEMSEITYQLMTNPPVRIQMPLEKQ